MTVIDAIYRAAGLSPSATGLTPESARQDLRGPEWRRVRRRDGHVGSAPPIPPRRQARLRRRSSSDSSAIRLAASAFASPAGLSSPLTPGSMISGVPPVARPAHRQSGSHRLHGNPAERLALAAHQADMGGGPVASEVAGWSVESSPGPRRPNVEQACEVVSGCPNRPVSTRCRHRPFVRWQLPHCKVLSLGLREVAQQHAPGARLAVAPVACRMGYRRPGGRRGLQSWNLLQVTTFQLRVSCISPTPKAGRLGGRSCDGLEKPELMVVFSELADHPVVRNAEQFGGDRVRRNHHRVREHQRGAFPNE